MDTIVKEGDLYVIYSEDRTKRLSRGYKTLAEAQERLAQIEYFKQHRQDEWDESQHPRDEHGRFGSGGGDGSKGNPKGLPHAGFHGTTETPEQFHTRQAEKYTKFAATNEGLGTEHNLKKAAEHRKAAEEAAKAHNLTVKAHENGGFTYSPTTGNFPSEGFAVAIHPEHEVKFQGKGALNEKQVGEYLGARKEFFQKNPSAHLGGWYNPDDDTWYLDVSHITNDKKEAVSLGARYNQKGIYDLKEGRTIPDSEYGEIAAGERGDSARWRDPRVLRPADPVARGDRGGHEGHPRGGAQGGGPTGRLVPDAKLAGMRARRDEIDRKLEALKIVRQDWDENQPRDEAGRWTSGGGNEGVDQKLTGAGSSSRPSGSAAPSPGLKAIAARMKEQYKVIGQGKLPEGHANYFKDRPDAKVVPISKLRFHASKEGAKGQAEEHMARALLGGNKREPLLVAENPDGSYDVLNGNHTATVAKEQGWKDLPVRVVEHPLKAPEFYSKEQTETMRASAKERLDKLREAGHMDHTFEEQEKIAEETLAKHQAALRNSEIRFSEVVGGKGVEVEVRVKNIGSALEKVARKAEKAVKEGKPIKYHSVADLQDGSGMRAILPTVKGDNIAFQKEKAAEIEKRYQVVAKDNYVDKPQDGYYRAIHYVVKDKDGLEKEVQLQTRRQQNFQHWSHDIYKPVNAKQKAAIDAHEKEIKAYAEKLSNYLYAKDLGHDPGEAPAALPKDVVEAFGTPRLDRALTT